MQLGNSVDDSVGDRPTVERREDDFVRVLSTLSGVPFTDANRVDLLRNGEEIFPAMLESIERAERSVDLLTFVYWSGDIAEQFASTLAAAASRGVRIRVLLDGVGVKPINSDLIDVMCDGGADVRLFRPPDPRHPIRSTHRTHRKVMVCDETVGYTGGVGIADEWMGDGRTAGAWRDTHLRVTGAAVAGLRAAFLDNWIETQPELFDSDHDEFPSPPTEGRTRMQVIKGTSQPGWNDISMTVRGVLDLARHRVRITTAYFVPDDDLQGRLLRAAERGVDVAVLVPGPHADKRFVQLAGEARYRELLDAGIAISTYQPSMLHAKVMTIDGVVAVVGSANFNHRSTSLDEEVNTVMIDSDVVSELDRDFESDLEHSEDLDLERWRSRSFPQIALERASDLIRPWM